MSILPERKSSILDIFSDITPIRQPVWFMRQAGRHLPEYRKIRESMRLSNIGFLDMCYNSEIAAEITLQPIKKYDIDAAIVFSDITVTLDAMGYIVTFNDNKGIHIKKDKHPISIDNINIDKFRYIAKTIKIIKEQLPNHIAMIGFCGGAFTLATYLLSEGIINNQTRSIIIQNIDQIDSLIEIINQANIEFISHQIEAGADIIQIFESHATFAANEWCFDRFITIPNTYLIKTIKTRYPSIPIILFPRGAGFFYEKIINTNCNAIGIDEMVSDNEIIKLQKNNIIIQGNLDNHLLCYGSKDEIISHTIKIMQRSNHKFIFNLGHGILKDTPSENVSLVIDTIRQQERII